MTTTGRKLIVFALLVASAFGAGAAIGAAAGPIDVGDSHSESPTTTVTIDIHDPHGGH